MKRKSIHRLGAAMIESRHGIQLLRKLSSGLSFFTLIVPLQKQETAMNSQPYQSRTDKLHNFAILFKEKDILSTTAIMTLRSTLCLYVQLLS